MTPFAAQRDGVSFGTARDQRHISNLIHGAWLVLTHPELPSCQDCQQYIYDEDWRPSLRRGLPVVRPDNCGPPCYRCPKIVRGSEPIPANAQQLSHRNAQVLEYFYLCRADTTGLLPRDRLVLRHNAILQRVHEQVQSQRSDVLPLITAMFGAKK